MPDTELKSQLAHELLKRHLEEGKLKPKKIKVKMTFEPKPGISNEY